MKATPKAGHASGAFPEHPGSLHGFTDPFSAHSLGNSAFLPFTELFTFPKSVMCFI